MFKQNNLITLIILSILSFNCQATDVQQSIESCSKLLPQGDSYKISILANVNKKGDDSKFTGEFSITANSDGSVKGITFDLSEFINCVAPLIKDNVDEADKAVKTEK